MTGYLLMAVWWSWLTEKNKQWSVTKSKTKTESFKMFDWPRILSLRIRSKNKKCKPLNTEHKTLIIGSNISNTVRFAFSKKLNMYPCSLKLSYSSFYWFLLIAQIKILVIYKKQSPNFGTTIHQNRKYCNFIFRK